MSDHTLSPFEDQLRAAAHDIVQADLAAAPAADPAAAEAIVAAAERTASAVVAPPVAAGRPRRIALWPTVAAAVACLALGYILPHPTADEQKPALDKVSSVAVAEPVEIVRTDTVYRDRPVPQIIERPVVQTVEVVRVDTVVVPAPAVRQGHAPRSFGNDGFAYACNAVAE